MRKPKWTAILGGAAAAVALLFGVPAVLRQNTGAKGKNFPGIFERQKACALRQAPGDTALARITYAEAVDSGVRVISADSLHRLLPNQAVLMLTRQYIDTLTHDTSYAIFGAPPIDDAALEHEYANVLAYRFRRTLIGSDTAKFLTSAYYRECVKYCPHCAAGAY